VIESRRAANPEFKEERTGAVMPINSRSKKSAFVKASLIAGAALALVMAMQVVLSHRGNVEAGNTESNMLVSTAWLAEHLSDRSIVIINIGPRASYDTGHIPGARFLEMSSIAASGQPLTLELPPVEKLKTSFEELGVSDNSRIVICFLANYVTPATRVYFTLDYLGLGKQTSLLDGGFEAWHSEGKTITTDAPAIKRGTITPHARPELVVDAAWVSANLNKPKVAIVDARAPEFYTGASAGRMPRAGHIPSAVNIPFSSLADDANKLKDSATLKKIFADAGITSGKEVVSYCHIGQQASLIYFVAKYLGYDARLYDGSFEDWSKRSELPVVGPASK
jgi:thiosulfate/3-mercaptopyruvate sulfurtransferase